MLYLIHKQGRQDRKPIWIPYNHATKLWEVWHEDEDEKMTFLGAAKTYKEARKVAGL